MDKQRFRPDVKETLDALLLSMPEVNGGKMFGLPGYYVNGKLFACVSKEGVGIKVPAELAETLLERKDVSHFAPFGRSKGKEWIQINHQQANEYTAEEPLFLQSIEFVRSLSLGV